MNESKKTYKAPALEKGLEILELLAKKQISLSMSEIATELGRSKNEIFRMLSVLESHKYLKKQEGTDKYITTNHLFDLGMKVPPTSTFLEFIFPIMNEIASLTDQSCHLSVRTGDNFVVIARVESPGPVGLAVRIGYSTKLVASNSGKVLLAWLPERLQIVERQKDYLPKGISPNELISELDIIREQIALKGKSNYMEGIIDICVPITHGLNNNKVIAAITIPYTSKIDNKFTLDETVDLLKENAQYISSKSSIYGGL